MASRSLKEVLRATLAEVQQSSELPQDDPTFVELKNSLIRTIAELTVSWNNDADTDPAGAFPALQSL